ncbi:MAG: hypothetical protein LBV21_04350 [Candidatus Adiutrix sp.]|jgi:hypothetical protein|nr:hypothetical protein [Candidatus Adiutrix sp.]
MPVLLMGGLAALVAGLVLFFVWLGAVLTLVKALAPLGLLGAGAVAVYLGWEEFRDLKKPALDFSSPDEANRYQAEAQAYQAEMNQFSRNDDPPAGNEPQSGEPPRPGS